VVWREQTDTKSAGGAQVEFFANFAAVTSEIALQPSAARAA
jgi:hypothetical protein